MDNTPKYINTITDYLRSVNIPGFQKRADFHILKFEDHLEEWPKTMPPQKYGFFQITATKNKDVNVSIEDTKFTAFKENISFLAPGQIVSVKINKVKKVGVGFMIIFSPEFLKFTPTDYSVLQNFPYFNINNPPVYFLEKEKQDNFISRMERIYLLFKDLNPDNLELIRSYLTIILLEIKTLYYEGEMKSSANSRAQEISFKFESLVKQTKIKRNTLGYYSSEMNISTIYLAECVKKVTKKTPKQIINEYIILEAKALLSQTTSTIDDIAFQLGFTDTSNYISFFKKQTGLTPNQYRKSIK